MTLTAKYSAKPNYPAPKKPSAVYILHNEELFDKPENDYSLFYDNNHVLVGSRSKLRNFLACRFIIGA